MRSVVDHLFLLIALGMAALSAQPACAAARQTDSLLLVCKQTVATHPERVKKLAALLLVKGTQENDRWLIGKSNYFLGKAHRLLGDGTSALPYLQKSLTGLRPYSSDLCASLKETGVVYYLLGESDKAMSFYAQALEIAKAHQLHAEISAITNNIGNLFDQQQQYGKAIAQYEEGLQSHPEPAQRIVLLANLAKAQAATGKSDTALAVYQQCLALARQQKDTSGLILALNGVASVYWRQERDADVLRISEALVKLQKTAGLTTDQIETYNRMGLAYLNLSDAPQALSHFTKALDLAKTVSYANTHYIYANLAFAYEELGNYKQAYTCFQKHKQLQDSLAGLAKNEQLAELLTRYEADKKAQQIRLLQQQKQLQQLALHKQQAELGRQTWLRNASVSTALLLLMAALVFMIFYRHKMQNKLLIAAHTEEINRQQTLELIRQQEIKSIMASLEGGEKERKRIARELHDGVAGSLAGIKLHLIRIADDTHQKPILGKVIQTVDAVYQEVRTISHNLNPPTIIDTAFVDLLRQQLALLAENSALPVDFFCHPEHALNQLSDALKIEIYRILQELMTNIVKHAEATSVEVHLTQTDDSINLMIEDQGKGFDTEATAHGVGLRNIRTRVAQLDGNLHLESVKGRGSIVSIDFPIREAVAETQGF